MDLSCYPNLNQRMFSNIINIVYKSTINVGLDNNYYYIENYLSNFGVDIKKAEEIKTEIGDKKLSVNEKLCLLNKYNFSDLLCLYLSFFDKLMGNRYLTTIIDQDKGLYIEKRLCYRDILKKDKKTFYYIVNNEKEKSLTGFRSVVDYNKDDIEKILKKSTINGLSIVLSDNILSSTKSGNNYSILDLFRIYKERNLFFTKKDYCRCIFLDKFLDFIFDNIIKSTFFAKTKFYSFFNKNKEEKGYSKISGNVFSYLSKDKKKIVKYWRSIGCDYDKVAFNYFITVLYFLNDKESVALYSLMKTYPFVMKVVIDYTKSNNYGVFSNYFKPLIIKDIVGGKYPFYDFMKKEFGLEKNEVKKLKGLTNHTAGSFLERVPLNNFKRKNSLKYISGLDSDFINKKSNIYNFYVKSLFSISPKLYNFKGFSIKNDFDFFKYINNQLLVNQKNKYSLNYRKYSYYSNRGKSEGDLLERGNNESKKRQEFLEFSNFYRVLILDTAYKIIRKEYKNINYDKKKLSLLVLNYFIKNLSPYCLFDLAELFHERWLMTSEMVNKYCAEMNINYKGLKLFSGYLDIGGYRFTDISSANELYDEGQFMNHCVGGYVNTINKNISSIIKVEPLFESCIIRERTTLNIKFVKKADKFEVRVFQNASFNNISPTESNNKAVSGFAEYLEKNIKSLNYEKIKGQTLSSSRVQGNDTINIIKNNFPWEYRFYLSLIPKYKMGISLEDNIRIAVNKVLNNKELVQLLSS